MTDVDSDSHEQGGVVNTEERIHEAMVALHTISSKVTDPLMKLKES